MMTKEYWYVGELCAENVYTTPIHLTEKEHEAVVKFLNQLNAKSFGYCGSCSIGDIAYLTERDCKLRNNKRSLNK